MLTQEVLHYGLHFFAPFVLGYLVSPRHWLEAGLIICAANLIDLDHLLAEPMFDPDRCSINEHPLHTYGALVCYAAVTAFGKGRLRIFGYGLVLHVMTDALDCYLSSYCGACAEQVVMSGAG